MRLCLKMKEYDLAWSNTYDLTLGKNYEVHIWKDSITLEQNRVNGFYENNVWKPSPTENRRRKNGETSFEVKLAKIERSESNIVALERCKTLDDIFNVFGYQEAKK